MGDWLNDNYINLAQELLRRQFNNLLGLMSTLFLTKLKEPLPIIDAVQVLHTRGNHWIVASTIGCSVGEVNVFDSLYSSVDAATLNLLKQLFGVHIKVKMMKYPQQSGGRECGLFAIANCRVHSHYLLTLHGCNSKCSCTTV
jgi:Ulp1 family protease